MIYEYTLEVAEHSDRAVFEGTNGWAGVVAETALCHGQWCTFVRLGGRCDRRVYTVGEGSFRRHDSRETARRYAEDCAALGRLAL